MNSFQNNLRNLARNNEIEYYPDFEIDTLLLRTGIPPYKIPYRYGDKFIRGIPVERMHIADSQALKNPRKNWFH